MYTRHDTNTRTKHKNPYMPGSAHAHTHIYIPIKKKKNKKKNNKTTHKFAVQRPYVWRTRRLFYKFDVVAHSAARERERERAANELNEPN